MQDAHPFAPRGLVPALAALFALTGCPANNGPGVDPVDRRAIVASAAEHVILPTYREFLSSARALEQTTSAWAATFDGDATDRDEMHGAARTAWLDAMRAWQAAELMQIGPAAPRGRLVGARGLRDEIYSWPTVNPCRVDQELVEANYTHVGFPSNKLVNVYGLDALEYLLFAPDTGNQCGAEAAINRKGEWAALGSDEIEKRRAAYAHRLAIHVASEAQQLVDAWERSGDGFLAQLQNAGQSGSDYPSAQAALDELFASLYYLELTVKDFKLGKPAGLHVSCIETTCPDAVESPWSGTAKENVVANLRAFRALFTGGETPDTPRPGFDDALRTLGAGALADEMLADTDAAIAAIESISVPLREAIADHPDDVRAAFTALKALTDDLKSQFVTVLNLRVPQVGAADND